MAYAYRIGADENGLGARLGPLVVTAVLAKVDPRGEAVFRRRPGRRLGADLDDSKRLVSHGNVALGEAWARALCEGNPSTPADLFEALTLEGLSSLTAPCPAHVARQCWSVADGPLTADDAVVKRLRSHLARWEARGVRVMAVKSSVTCTRALNEARRSGRNRFVSDLHAMERLVIRLRREAGSDVLAVCGKVGGIDDYSKFFGPLSDRLHSVLERGKARSAYRFPGVGEVSFVRDADASDPLVMLASLVGKYVRELLMTRVSRFYGHDDADHPAVSGYHDPSTSRFVDATAILRRGKRVPKICFERDRDVRR